MTQLYQLKGCGKNYFDPEQPTNNIHMNYKFFDKKSSAELEALSLIQLSIGMFADWSPNRETQQKIIRQMLDQEMRLSELAYRFQHDRETPTTYSDNRDNLLFLLALHAPGSNYTEEEELLFKDLVRATIASGVSPLEKDNYNGLSFFAALLKNSAAISPELLVWCSKLHPQSLIDLTEGQSTLMSIALGTQLKPEKLYFFAHLVPEEALPENLISLENFVGDNPHTSAISDILKSRIEQSALQKNLKSSDNSNISLSLKQYKI